MSKIELAGTWALRDVSGDYDVPMALPGDAVCALHEAGVLPDPYWGRNEYECRWVAERDWTISRSINLERTDLEIVLDRVDTVAEVRINGTLVLSPNNAFRVHRQDVSDVLKVGENLIEITFPSSVRVAAERQAAQPFRVPYQKDNCPIPNPNMLRKPQCDFGWDWNIALAPFGIYGAMHFEPLHPLRISHLLVHQAHERSGVRVTVEVHTSGPGAGDVEVTFDGHTEHLTFDGSDHVGTASFEVTSPELWWPAGYGAQPLYDLDVRLGDQVEKRRIGLRQLDLISTPDDIGASFRFQVNGVPVFCKGANWIPADALPSRVTQEATRDLLQSAVDANMNMIRVWGGGRYEPDWFYDLCDELGLMVWQDFMFACSLYPSDDAYLDEVDREVREVVARLQSHACLALWCGDNENVGALGWFEESRKDRDRYLAAYDRLNHVIERGLAATDPHANWWPSSPSRGRLDFGDGWHDDTAGDMHFWSVWHEGRDFDHYRDVSPRFCSEFGFQSYPSLDQIRTFAGPEDMNIAAPVLESHQKNKGGNARIAETMFRYFRFPEGFENFVYLSQVQQALAIKTAVTDWRAKKPRCMGTLYWQLNDTWPVCSWSSLDYGGGWKLLHHVAKAFFAPVLCTIVPSAESYELKVVSDTLEEQDVTFRLEALSMSGTPRDLASGTQHVAIDKAMTLVTLRKDAVAEDEVLVLRWRVADGPWQLDHFAPRPYKSYDLPDPGAKLAVEGNRLTITVERPAFFVAFEADIPGRFSQNGVLVLPGEPAEVTFTPKNKGDTAQFTLRDLRSATYSHHSSQKAS